MTKLRAVVFELLAASLALIAVGFALWEWPLVAICLLIVALVIYGLLLAADAKKYINVAPKKDMYVCDIHGPMPISGTHVLFDGEVMEQTSADGLDYRGPVRMCAICFETRIKQAKARA